MFNLELREFENIDEKILSNFKKVGDEISFKLSKIQNLVVNEDSLQSIKKIRAGLNKDLTEWETKRKEFKKEIIKPYENFNKLYDSYIKKSFVDAENNIKLKINEFEDFLFNEKKSEVFDFFEDYKKSIDLNDCPGFELLFSKIRKSDSIRTIKNFLISELNKINEIYKTVFEMEYGDEIWNEYKKNLNFALSINTVNNRKKEIKENNLKIKNKTESIEIISESLEELILTLTFSVTDNKLRLKKLKNWMLENSYKFN